MRFASGQARCLQIVALGGMIALGLGSTSLTSRPTPAAPAPLPASRVVPDRNRVHFPSSAIPPQWDVSKRTNILWSVPLGSLAFGGPVVAGGKVFVGTNNDQPRDPKVTGDKGVLMCFDANSGKFLWQAVHDKLAAGRVNDWPNEGIASSPAVDGDRLYYVNNRCEVVCADVNGDPKNPGKAVIRWIHDMVREDGVFPHNRSVCSPLVVGDLVFAVTPNGVDEGHINIPSPEAPSFLALDRRTGKTVWQNNFPTARLAEARKRGQIVDFEAMKNAGQLLLHGQWSSPVHARRASAGQVIFPGGDGWMYSFKPRTGELLWKFDCNPKAAVFGLGRRATRNHFLATPVVCDNKLYVAVGEDPEHRRGVGHLWCVDITKRPGNADKDLSPVNDNFNPRAAVNKDSALVWHYGGAMANPRGGRPYHFGRSLSTCAVHDGLCYAADLDGFVYCLDARTGQLCWRHDSGGEIRSSPYWIDGKVYLGNDNADVLVFKHGREKKLLTTVVMGDLVRTSAVALGDILYVVTQNPARLYAIAGK